MPPKRPSNSLRPSRTTSQATRTTTRQKTSSGRVLRGTRANSARRLQDVKVIKVPNRRGSFTIHASPRARVGDSGVIDGVRYTIRSEMQLRDLVRQRNWDDVVRTCTSRVTSMRGLFKNTSFNHKGIGHWDTSRVTDMSYMFQYACAFNQPIGAWNTRSVTNMEEMFVDAEGFNQPIGTWDTSSVTDMRAMFLKATSFNQPIGAWDTRRVTNMSWMFSGARTFNKPIGAWNTRSVTNMQFMFARATAFNQDLSLWIDKLPENVHREFVKMMIQQDVYKTVRRLYLKNIFTRKPYDLPIRSVQMLKLVRATYHGYRPSQVEYENLHEDLHPDMSFTPRRDRIRIIALIDFLNREEANLRPSMRYNKTKSRSIIRNINQRTNRKRMTALASIDRSAARKNLHIPKEIMSQILHAASLKALPYTHARGVNRRAAPI